jgi:hypothetical protein
MGLVYSREGDVFFCDHAWHFVFRNQRAAEVAGLYWANTGLDEFNREVMIDFTRKLAVHAEGLPYGFNVRGEAFEQETGRPMPIPPGEGLTCATFVLAAHRHRGIELLLTDGWPLRDDDAAWQEEVIDQVEAYCEEHGIECERHLERLRGEVGTKRYRPDEVAAGATSPMAPLAFEDARRLADEIVTELDDALNG